jgi:AcrR family transcriptional regulator
MWQDRSAMASSSSTAKRTRQRVPASERRDALIEAATHEFAHGGLYGTPVDRVARRVGVAQPYVFSLFGSKRELFLAAVQRSFQRVEELFTRVADDYDPAIALPDATVLKALGQAYVQMLETDRDQLLLQHQAYAACGDDVVREAVRRDYARLVARVQELTGAAEEEIDEFMRYGMWLNVAAAMGVPDLSVGCEWVRDELAGAPADEL